MHHVYKVTGVYAYHIASSSTTWPKVTIRIRSLLMGILGLSNGAGDFFIYPLSFQFLNFCLDNLHEDTTV